MPGIREILSYLVGGGGKPGDDANLTPEQKEGKDVQKWSLALEHSKKFVDDWHKQGTRAVSAFLDDRSGQNERIVPSYRLNLFHSNIQTLKASLFAKLPKVEADRRFLDPNDDVARVAGEMITRILQNDMNDPDDGLEEVLKAALEDRLVPGLGCARMKYDLEETPAVEASVDPATGMPVPETPATKADEWCEPVYTHWRDVLWNPCRTAAELTWKAFRAYMDKPAVEKRFGKEVAEALSYNTNGPRLNQEKTNEIEKNDPQAEVWEIWDNDTKMVYWYSKGYQKFLDQKPDPLKLDGFYPDGRWMVANTSTSKYLPKPDYEMAKTLYLEIDELESRIALLTAACKVVGVYDRQSKDIQRMLTEGVENQLIPVDNWAMFAERGGLRGQVDWLPVEAVVNALQVLTNQQLSRINQLYQVTGFSDIMRGQASTAGTTATEQRIKAQFGSVRIQALQDEFATFASDLLNKKVQIIQRYYDPQRIVELSNVANTPDAQLAERAVALIKDFDSFNIRIAIRAESMAQIDYDQLREERTGFLQAVAQFMGQAGPLIEQKPEAAPFLMQLLQFGVSGFKASSEMEGVIDQGIAALKQAEEAKAAQPKQPSPEEQKATQDMKQAEQQAALDAEKQKQDTANAQQLAEQQLAAARQKAELDTEKTRDDMARESQKFNLEMEQMREEHKFKMEEMQAQLRVKTGGVQDQLDEIQSPLVKQLSDSHSALLAHINSVSDGLSSKLAEVAKAATAPRKKTPVRNNAGAMVHVIDEVL